MTIKRKVCCSCGTEDGKISITCDICAKEYTCELEMQEFLCYSSRGGYGSIFGDGDDIEIDICQYCLRDVLGKFLRIKQDPYYYGRMPEEDENVE